MKMILYILQPDELFVIDRIGVWVCVVRGWVNVYRAIGRVGPGVSAVVEDLAGSFDIHIIGWVDMIQPYFWQVFA